MSDRELLEAAARAAGYVVEWNKVLECFMFVPTETEWHATWKPLDSDADAFRLMVDCGIEVIFYEYEVCAGEQFEITEKILDNDKHAAARRAIVRAAAAMGVR